ncbi:hypothetical protein L2K70_10295 [Nocardioides KLBMP 9356]|uniref:Uncharacterized protein n=1 Tax=Nocardioides potassii TaxID=2911371 RepID=A0ABS9H9W0_9ACTN|nr:hypothetical protein [Nocardioides potassii]MCF6377995.1 hypothetical protein [Nocardioides potassii]
MTLVASTLDVTGNRWRRSDGYDRLDGTEKGAVSYFHGMTMAQLACAEVLDVPSLVHLDRVLALMGKKATHRSRPDFLGVHPFLKTTSVAVEAKGRSNGIDLPALKTAKDQAKLLPTVTGVVATLAVASMSYFAAPSGSDPAWQCRLEDPPRQRSADVIDRSAIIALHYEPLVAAASSRDADGQGEFLRWHLRDVDAWLWLPAVVFELGVPLLAGGSLAMFEDVGAAIEAALIELVEAKDFSERLDIASRSRDAGRFYLGQNGVGIELGESWSSVEAPA